MARPDLRVIALDGDGAALMRMGAFATVGALGPPNLVHLLLDNAAHDSTGGQATGSPLMSFAGVAAACGYREALEGDDVETVDEVLAELASDGPRFARIRISAGTPADLPRPSITPVEVKERLMKHIATRQGGL
jgi:phosphonopyruvate decarboxylase